MMENPEHIDRVFKEKFDTFSEQPEAGVWDNIADRLGHNKKRSMILFLTRIAAGIALLLALSIGLTNRFNKNESVTDNNIHIDNQDSRDITNEKSTPNIPVTVKEEKHEVNKNTDDKEPGRKVRKMIPENNFLAEKSHNKSGNKANENNEAASELPVTMHNSPDAELLAVSSTPEESLPVLEGIYSGMLDNSYTVPIRPSLPVQPEKFKWEGILLADETSEKPDMDKWQLGGQFGPVYSYRNLTTDYISASQYEATNNKDKAVIAYAGGLNITFNAGKRFSLQSGLAYSKYGQEKTGLVNTVFKTSNPEYYNNPDANSGFIANAMGQKIYVLNASGSYSTSANMDMESGLFVNLDAVRQPSSNMIYAQSNGILESVSEFYEYMEIPLVMRYKIIDRKIDLTIMGGGSANILVNTSLYENYSDDSRYYGRINDVRHLNYSSLLGLGIEYPISSNFVVTVEPKFKYYLNPIDKESYFDIRPYSIGVLTGINYRF